MAWLWRLPPQWERCPRLMEQLLPQYWSTNGVPHAFFPRVAIGCRLSLKIDRNLPPSWAGELIGGYKIWYDVNRRYGIWIEYLYRSVYCSYSDNFPDLRVGDIPSHWIFSSRARAWYWRSPHRIVLSPRLPRSPRSPAVYKESQHSCNIHGEIV